MKEVTFRLPVFEGPLELLLHLLGKNKVSITDIPIALILEQYLAYIQSMREFDLAVASEFIAMAAQLMYIKSKMLLPVHGEEEGDDPRTPLVEALIEYQQIRSAAEQLHKMNELGLDLYVKQQEPIDRQSAREFRHTAEQLLSALSVILERSERRLPPPPSAFEGIVGHEPVPVDQKINQIVALFMRKRELDFASLVRSAASRSEIVAVFLAVLELLKARKIAVFEREHGYTLELAED